MALADRLETANTRARTRENRAVETATVNLHWSALPWKCPACEAGIRHDGDAPQLNQVYRCHICRLELILDRSTQKLTLAPLPFVGEPARRRVAATNADRPGSSNDEGDARLAHLTALQEYLRVQTEILSTIAADLNRERQRRARTHRHAAHRKKVPTPAQLYKSN